MRLMAPEYVLSERFVVWSSETLAAMLGKGFQVDAAISIWVLQHVHDLTSTLQQLYAALKPDALLYALNSQRCVPTTAGWLDDGHDVHATLRTHWAEKVRYQLPVAASSEELSEKSLVQVLARRA